MWLEGDRARQERLGCRVGSDLQPADLRSESACRAGDERGSETQCQSALMGCWRKAVIGDRSTERRGAASCDRNLRSHRTLRAAGTSSILLLNEKNAQSQSALFCDGNQVTMNVEERGWGRKERLHKWRQPVRPSPLRRRQLQQDDGRSLSPYTANSTLRTTAEIAFRSKMVTLTQGQARQAEFLALSK